MIKKGVNWCSASCVCSLRPVSGLRGGTFSAGQPATCTSSQGTSLESWSSGSLECTFPAPPQPSASLSPASSCSCWCRGSSLWACAASRSFAAVRTVGAWRRDLFSAACPGFAHWREGVTGGLPDHGWLSPGVSWLLIGSQSWRWRGHWKRSHSRLRHHPYGSCSSSHMEGRTNGMGHLDRDRTRERANISLCRTIFFPLVLSFRADHHEEKNETLTQREP